MNYFGQFLISDDAHNKNKNRSGKSGERDVVSNPPLGYIIDLPGYGTWANIGVMNDRLTARYKSLQFEHHDLA